MSNDARRALGAATLITLAWTSVCSGAYTAREVYKIHQHVFNTATDLHIKFWQKEDDIHITDFDVGNVGGAPQPDSVRRGDQPSPYHERVDPPHAPPGTAPDDGSHAVDLDWNTLNIPNCNWVSVPFSWTLTEKNKKQVRAEWTSGTQPRKKNGPMHGWEVDPPRPGGGGWYHRIHLVNYDIPTEPDALMMYVRNFRYALVLPTGEISYATLDSWTDWLPAAASLDISPGTESFFDVWTELNVGHVLLTYDLWDTPGKQATVIEIEVGDHPTPEPTSFAILASASMLLQRRRSA